MIAERLTKKSDVVNWLGRQAGFRSYLEISTAFSGFQFGKIDRNQFVVAERVVYCATADFDDGLPVTGVSFSDDSGPGLAALSINLRRFDVVFVDSWHSYESSYRDIEYALQLLSMGGVIVVHDCLPLSREIADPKFHPGSWSGQTYLAFLDFVRKHVETAFVTIDMDFGCGVIQTRNEHGEFRFGQVPRHDALSLDHSNWEAFSNFGADALCLLSPKQFVRIFRLKEPSVTSWLCDRLERPIAALRIFQLARLVRRAAWGTHRRVSRRSGEHAVRERLAIERRNQFLEEFLGLDPDNLPSAF